MFLLVGRGFGRVRGLLTRRASRMTSGPVRGRYHNQDTPRKGIFAADPIFHDANCALPAGPGGFVCAPRGLELGRYWYVRDLVLAQRRLQLAFLLAGDGRKRRPFEGDGLARN